MFVMICALLRISGIAENTFIMYLFKMLYEMQKNKIKFVRIFLDFDCLLKCYGWPGLKYLRHSLIICNFISGK